MKLTSLAILIMAFGASAGSIAAAPAKAEVVASALAAPAAQTDAQAAVTEATKLMSTSHNPFTGKSLTVEQIQLKLEAAKLQTQTLEELLKQTNLNEELNNVPLRKAVEAAQARTSVKKEELAQHEMEGQVRAALAAAEAAAREAKAAAQAAKPKTAKQKAAEAKQNAALFANAPAPLAPAPAKPVLLSVLDVAGAKSVVLDFSGATLVAADGDNTPAGTVRIIDGGSASLNGEIFKVRSNTLSRFVVSDPKLDPDAKKGGPLSAPVAMAGTPAPGTPASASALPPLPSSYPSAKGGGSPFGAGVTPGMMPSLTSALVK